MCKSASVRYAWTVVLSWEGNERPGQGGPTGWWLRGVCTDASVRYAWTFMFSCEGKAWPGQGGRSTPRQVCTVHQYTMRKLTG